MGTKKKSNKTTHINFAQFFFFFWHNELNSMLMCANHFIFFLML